jgi:ribonuclease VapC
VPVLSSSVVSTVNWSEVLQKLHSGGGRLDEALELVDYGLELIPFDADHALETARLWDDTRQAGLSFADRACIATAVRLGLNVMTTDRSWAALDLPIEVVVLR